MTGKHMHDPSTANPAHSREYLQDAVRQICIKISERAPEFGVGVLLPELLQDTMNWDILLIGLQTLITILLGAPTRQRASLAGDDAAVPFFSSHA